MDSSSSEKNCSQEEISQRVERWYKVFCEALFLLKWMKGNNSQRLCKILPSCIFLNPRWRPKLNEISFVTITFVLVVGLQLLVLFCGYDRRSDYFTMPKLDINVKKRYKMIRMDKKGKTKVNYQYVLL